VEFNPDQSGLPFRFPTAQPSGFAENDVVYGRFYRCAGRWQEHPVIVLLHGGNVMQGRDGSLGCQLGYQGRGPGWNRV